MRPMFSYRHAFHAGNHADVLKHMTLVAILQYMGQKETGFTVVDTHAGAGVYRLDQEHARTSAESDAGIFRLIAAVEAAQAGGQPVPEPVLDYMQQVRSFNSGKTLRTYPGSPWIAQALLRPQDRLKLFEVHPTDARLLDRQVAELGRGRQIEVLRRNGFEGLKSLLPTPTRRGLVLMDPSYELKTDYAAVVDCIEEALKRFPTGSYAVWYPVIGRPEAHAPAPGPQLGAGGAQRRPDADRGQEHGSRPGTRSDLDARQRHARDQPAFHARRAAARGAALRDTGAAGADRLGLDGRERRQLKPGGQRRRLSGRTAVPARLSRRSRPAIHPSP